MTKGREWNAEVDSREDHSGSRALIMTRPTERNNKTLTAHGDEECHRQRDETKTVTINNEGGDEDNDGEGDEG